MPHRRYPSIMSLKAFEAVARHGSFKSAAEEMAVTAGALSQQVKNLEDHLGIKLFIRKNREIETTAEGETLKNGLIEAFKHIRESVDAIRPDPATNALVVLCDPPFASKWLAPRLHNFVSTYPDIDVRVQSQFRIDGSESFDLAVCMNRDNMDGLFQEAVMSESLVPVASPDFIRENALQLPEDVERVPLLREESLRFCPKSPTWQTWMKHTKLKESLGSKGVNFGNHAEQAIDAALAGGGVLLARKSLASFDLMQKRLAIPFGPELEVDLQYFFACTYENLEKRNVRLFRTWLKHEIANMEATDPRQFDATVQMA